MKLEHLFAALSNRMAELQAPRNHCIALIGEPASKDLADLRCLIRNLDSCVFFATHAYPSIISFLPTPQRLISMDRLFASLDGERDLGDVYTFGKTIISRCCCGWIFTATIDLEAISIASSVMSVAQDRNANVSGRILCSASSSIERLNRMPNVDVPPGMILGLDQMDTFASQFNALPCSHISQPQHDDT